MPACRQCRARKVRCDRRPGKCSGCSRLAVPCVYPETRTNSGYSTSASAASTTSATIAATSPSSFYSRFRLQQPGHQGHAQTNGHDDDRYDRDNYTEAGLKRRRAQKACLACRRDKLKCSGTDPCTRCKTRNAACDWAGGKSGKENLPAGPSVSSPPPRNHTQSRLPPVSINDDSEHTPTSAYAGEGPASSYSATPPRNTSDMYERLDNLTMRRYIDAYFLYGHTSGFLFPILLKSLVLADWKSGQINPLLLKAIIAFGVSLLHDEDDNTKEDDELRRQDNEQNNEQTSSPAISLHHGRAWLSDVRRDILLGHLGGRPSLALVQALVILMRYYLLTGHGRITTWNLLAVAARFVFSLALNYEDISDSVDATARETRRRAVWAIYAIDQLLCGGIDDLSVCHQGRIHIRLPCSERSFQRGILSAAPFADGSNADARSGNSDHEDMDMLAYYLQLLGHRHKILQYTKRLRLASTSPELSKHELVTLQQGLTAFAQTLPVHLRNTPQNMVLMAHATDTDADWYLNLHILFLQCHCDLYRHTVPHLREALRPDVIRLSSPAYVTACQDACLDAAVALCRLWTDARQLDFPRNGNRALFLAACMYQVAQILIHLRRRLDSNDDRRRDATPDATARLAESLRDALTLLGDRKHHAALMGRPYVQEIRKMIAILKMSEREAALLYEKDTDVPQNSRMYMSMSSRHSLIETLSGDPAGGEEEGQEKDTGEDRTGVADDDMHAAKDTNLPATVPSAQQLNHAMQEGGLVAITADVDYGTDGLLQEVLPWGVDDYYDPMLGLVVTGDDLGDGMMQPYAYDVPAYGQIN